MGASIAAADGPDPHTAAEVFEYVYKMMSFFAALWVVGKISVFGGMPALVGEIITGIILGPYLIDMVPYPSALIVLGDIGLLLLVLEAGIDVNMGILKVVGTRGLMVAVFGSMFPLVIGLFLAFSIDSTMPTREAVAIGACFAPTSMGIAINVLRNGRILNTPTGQLIVAAAVLDDVIALMLLSVLSEFSVDEPSIVDITLSIMVSPVFILIFGFIAVKVSPGVIKYIMDKIDIKYHEYAILLLLFGSMLILVPACFYAKSSYLLGAFLAGLMFCTDHTMHHVWEKQMKRIMQWILRIFFACTIGFAVPIQDFFGKPKLVINALIYFVAIIGKLATGIFAPNKPIRMVEFCTISFAMAAWGEFAFILATVSYSQGIFDKDTMTSILMAVLFSVIIAPLLLRATLQFSAKRKTHYIEDTRKNQSNTAILSGMRLDRDSLTDSAGGTDASPTKVSALQSDSNIFIHPVYYCIHTKTYAKWGHQHRLLKSLYSLKLELIDFRSFNETQDNYVNLFVQDVFYVKDTRLALRPTKQLNVDSKQKLSKRVKFIRAFIKKELQNDNAKVSIMRWLPGIKQIDDMTPSHTPSKQVKIPPSYVKNEAYKQARMALSYMRLPRMRHDANESKITDESIAKNIISNPAPAYIGRIHEKDETDRRRLSYVASDVLDEEHDILQQIKFADDIEASINDDENTMSLEIIYGDTHGHRSPLEVNSPNSIKVVKFNIPKSPNPNQNTPLLKGPLE